MKFNTEINRFLLVGLLTVFIDFLFYNLFILIGISYNLAKGISFLSFKSGLIKTSYLIKCLN